MLSCWFDTLELSFRWPILKPSSVGFAFARMWYSFVCSTFLCKAGIWSAVVYDRPFPPPRTDTTALSGETSPLSLKLDLGLGESGTAG